MNDNIIRHEVLQDLPTYMYANNFDVSYIIPFDELLKLKGDDKKYLVKRKIAIHYLLATGYLKYGVERGTKTYYVSITQKGLDACNSLYFLSQYDEEIKLRNNNRWMISTNFILALGVVYSIFHDNFKCSKTIMSELSQPKQEQVYKMEYPALAPTKTHHASTLSVATDSSKR